MRIVIIILAFTVFPLFGDAQVSFNEHPSVQKLMDYYISKGQSEDIIDGWRIKIISTTDRRALENAKYLFERNFPEYKFSQEYEAPHYSLKVGAYETRMDLEPMLVAFKENFPLAIPFRDRIKKQELF